MSNENVCFTNDTNRFRLRAGAIIKHNDKILFVKDKGSNLCYVIGGCVQFGETTKQCIVREIEEETNMKIKDERLVVICENFFKGTTGVIKGYDCHNICFYYLANVSEEDVAKCPTINDDGEELVWLSISEINKDNIKPTFVGENINAILETKEILHIENIDK